MASFKTFVTSGALSLSGYQRLCSVAGDNCGLQIVEKCPQRRAGSAIVDHYDADIGNRICCHQALNLPRHLKEYLFLATDVRNSKNRRRYPVHQDRRAPERERQLTG